MQAILLLHEKGASEMLQPPLKDELTRILEGHSLDEELKEEIHQEAQAAIQFHVEHEENYEHIGNSRIAGYPDLPPSIEWPCDSDGEYYTFIAQINLGEMPFSPYEGLPHQGILYFFLGLDEPAYDIDHKIFYYNGDSSALKKTLPPTGKVEVCAENRGFTSYAISFQPIVTLRSEGELGDVLVDQYEELYELVCEQSDTVWGQHQSFAGTPGGMLIYAETGWRVFCLTGIRVRVRSIRKSSKLCIGEVRIMRSIYDPRCCLSCKNIRRIGKSTIRLRKIGMFCSRSLLWTRLVCAGGTQGIWNF